MRPVVDGRVSVAIDLFIPSIFMPFTIVRLHGWFFYHPKNAENHKWVGNLRNHPWVQAVAPELQAELNILEPTA